MNLYSIKTIKGLLKAHKTAPNNLLGQNFLLQKRVASKMLGASGLSSKDTVLEIGPGIGTLTRELAQNAGRVIAVEKDPALAEILKKTTKDFQNIDIIQGDILNVNLKRLSYSHLKEIKFKVVANLPYYITSPVVRLFLETEHKPELMVLMVQKEVAQRIVAQPPDMNLLAVSVQFYAEPKIISSVHKGAFWPQPKVDSAILKLNPVTEPLQIEPKTFFRIVKAGFTQPRKQLLNNLSNQLKLSRKEIKAWLAQVGIDPKQRAETLSLGDWISLAKSLPLKT